MVCTGEYVCTQRIYWRNENVPNNLRQHTLYIALRDYNSDRSPVSEWLLYNARDDGESAQACASVFALVQKLNSAQVGIDVIRKRFLEIEAKSWSMRREMNSIWKDTDAWLWRRMSVKRLLITFSKKSTSMWHTWRNPCEVSNKRPYGERELWTMPQEVWKCAGWGKDSF